MSESAFADIFQRMDDYVESLWREIYEERAAIMEYDGGLPREAAEQLAGNYVRRQKARIEAR